MSGEAMMTIWEFLAKVFFFGISLVGAAFIMTMAWMKAKEFYDIIRTSNGKIIQ